MRIAHLRILTERRVKGFGLGTENDLTKASEQILQKGGV